MSYLENCARHLVFAVRTMARHRGSYLPAAGILALGIGMSVAMFSLVDAVLLRPLPFPGQESIQVIWKVDRQSGNQLEELAYPELGDLQQIREFESVAVMPTSLYGYARVLQVGNAEPVQIESTPVSHDFFRVLGAEPVLGRGFAGSDEQVGAAPVVELSDRVWREQFGADPGIVGRLIRLNGIGNTVIGVMGPGVEFPRGAGLWIPLGVEKNIVERRGATFLQAIARVKPGYSGERAADEVKALFKRLAVEHPESYSPSQEGVVTPLVEYWTGSARMHLWIMLGASLLLLVASIVSAGNLLLSRTLSREAEIATRLAIGAGRGQILAQLGAEGALVAMLAVAAGLCVAESAIRLVVKWAPADIPRLTETALDLNTFWFAAATAILAMVGCAVLPGWAATRMHIEQALREGGGRLSMSQRGARTRSMFVLVQTAVTVMLLAMASLFLLSYRSMMSADIGFANRDALSMNLQLRGQGYDGNSRRLFYSRLLSRLREAQGVTSAAAILTRPLEGPIGWDVSYDLGLEGSASNRVLPKANYEVVTPGYFRTVGTALIEGRDFDEHDTQAGEAVVIISRSLAEQIRKAGFSPIGYRLRLGLGPRGGNKVVGVAADARYRNITQRGVDLFVPYLQAGQSTNYVVLRGTRTAQDLAGLVRQTVSQIDSTQAVAGVATIGELIDRNATRHRFNMILLIWFGVCALILAAMGVYSVIAEGVTARRREIAIKTVLGARKPRLVREMVYRALVFVVAGEVAGLGCVALLGNLASELLYGVSSRDPRILGSVAGFLFVASVLAALCPAWIAAASNPECFPAGELAGTCALRLRDRCSPFGAVLCNCK